MGAKNTVVAGDYKGGKLKSTKTLFFDGVTISWYFKTIRLSSKTVKSYSIVDEDVHKSAVSGAMRGVAGGLLLGGIGAAAGVYSAKNKKSVMVSIEFADGKRSLVEVNQKMYDAIIRSVY